jgi:cytochrome c oxidase assembly protein subunit 15
MTDTRSDRLPALLAVTLGMVFALVVWGGVVRLSGSGLAIPDWPLAEGKLLPRPHPNVLIEYGHRFLAMLVSLGTVAVSVLIFRSPAHRARLGGLAVAALAALAFQVFLGARVVLEGLPIDRVVAHLLVAFTFFAILLHMALRLIEREPLQERDPRAKGLAKLGRLTAGAVFLQAGLGAWVSSSGAALACPDFPTCQGSWLPPLVGLVGIHYAHRLGAYAIAVLVVTWLLLASRARLPHRARWPIRFSGILVAIQILLGIGNVLLRVPLPVGAAHLGTALALFGMLLAGSYELAHV